MQKKKILITGASGLIGGMLWRHFSAFPDRYDLYALDRTREPSRSILKDMRPEIPDDRFTTVDIAAFDAVRDAVAGMDVVLHCAANPRPTIPWEELLHCNLIGTYNVLEASFQAHVKRIVYASSIRVSIGYCHYDEPYKLVREGRLGRLPSSFPKVDHNSPVRPVEAYGAIKVFGEALARSYADRGMSCICLRIGAVNASNSSRSYAGIWCSHRDLAQIFQKSVDAPESLKFDIFFALSESPLRCFDIGHARDVIGYIPQDSDPDEPPVRQDGKPLFM